MSHRQNQLQPVKLSSSLGASDGPPIISDFTSVPRAPTSAKLHQPKQPIKIMVTKPGAKPHSNHKSGRRPHHLKAHQPQTAKTLMRQAVQKPAAATPKTPLRLHAPVDSAFAYSQHKSRPQTFYHGTDNERLSRAQQAARSHLVKHFHHNFHHNMPTIIQPIALNQPAAPTAKPQPVQPLEQLVQELLTPIHNSKTKPHTKSPDVSHKRSRKQVIRFSNRFVITTLSVVGIVLVTGLLYTQSLPQIDVKLASVHAGFQASLPSFAPGGFNFVTTVQAKPGSVELSYRSATDNRTFSILQQNTNWSDQTLADYVKSTGALSQILHADGHQLYLYSNHLAWISRGVWYQITNQADLSSTQLLNIATSM